MLSEQETNDLKQKKTDKKTDKKSNKLPWILVLVLSVVCAGGYFYIVISSLKSDLEYSKQEVKLQRVEFEKEIIEINAISDKIQIKSGAKSAEMSAETKRCKHELLQCKKVEKAYSETSSAFTSSLIK